MFQLVREAQRSGVALLSQHAAGYQKFVGTDMTVPVTFERSLSGVMGTFLQLLDVDEVWTGMTQFGNWTPTSMSTPKPVPFVCLIQVPTYDKVLTKVDAYSGHTAGLSALSMINIHEVQLNIPMVFNPASRQDRMHLWQSDAMGWRAIGLTLCAPAGDRALRHFIPRSPQRAASPGETSLAKCTSCMSGCRKQKYTTLLSIYPQWEGLDIWTL